MKTTRPYNQLTRCLVSTLLLLIGLQAKPTGLSGDVISIKGADWYLMAKPIYADSALYSRLTAFLPKNHCISTANSDGYTAFWEVADSSLMLRRIEVCVYDKSTRKDSTLVFGTKDLKNIFASYYIGGEIKADWFSGIIRAGKGDLVRYVHDGFDQNMETEQVLTIEKGNISHSETYHNSRKKGLNLMHAQDEIAQRFPWNRFPEYRGQQIIFSMKDFRMTEDGHLQDCKISFVLLRPSRKEITDNNHPLVKALKETLKSIYPWEVLFVNGKYRMEYSNYTMPIRDKSAGMLHKDETSKVRIENTTKSHLAQSSEWHSVGHGDTVQIKYKLIKSDDGIEGLKIEAYDGHRNKVQDISYSYPPDTELGEESNAGIDLQDVNFDGKCDLLIYLGQYGNQGIRYYDCFIWNEKKHKFQRDDSFKSIENPQIDKERKCIFSFARISAASYSYGKFAFIGGRFVKTAELKETYGGAGQAPLFTEKKYVKGKGLITLHKNVVKEKISGYWKSVVQ